MTRRTRRCGSSILQAALEAGRVGAIMGAGRAGTGGAPSGGGRSNPPNGRAAARRPHRERPAPAARPRGDGGPRNGGGLALLIHLGAADSARAAADWLRQHGVDPPESPHSTPNGATPAKYPELPCNRPASRPERPERPRAAWTGARSRCWPRRRPSPRLPPIPPAAGWRRATYGGPMPPCRPGCAGCRPRPVAGAVRRWRARGWHSHGERTRASAPR